MAPLLSIFEMGLLILVNLVRNLVRKLIFPKKDYIPYTFLGLRTLSMIATLSGSIFTPSFDTICPNNLPLVTPKVHFLGFNDTPYSNALIKNSPNSYNGPLLS